MANLNTGNFSDAIKTMYERRLLTRAQPRLVHARWAMPAVFRGFGSWEVRKYGSLSAATTALSEGVTPSEDSAPSLTTVTITPNWYGSWLQFTDELDLTAFDPIVSEMVGILGEQSGLTVDTLVRNAITDGSTTDYANAITARASLTDGTDEIDYDDIVDQIAALEAENARPVDGGMYVAIIHPLTWGQLMKDTDFQTVFTREGGQSIRSGEVGHLFNTKFFISANARVYEDGGASNADVYGSLFIGAESYAVAGIATLMPNLNMDGGGEGFANNTGKDVKAVEIILKPLGSSGTADPLDQRGTAGWKAAHEEAILNSVWIRELEALV